MDMELDYLIQIAMKYPNIRIVPTDKYIAILKKFVEKAKRKNIKLNYNRSTISCFLCKSRYPPLGFILKLSENDKSIWNFTFQEINYIRGERTDKSIKLVKSISSELFYLLGAFRDGSISRHKYQIQITQKNRVWIEKIVNPYMKKVFGLTLNYYGFKKGAHIFSVSSKPLFAFLELVGGFRNKFKTTPQIILNSTFNLQKYYIGGFYDAEGDKSLKAKRIGIYQAWKNDKNCPPLNDIKNILGKQKIKSIIHKMGKRKNSFLFHLYIFKNPYENVLNFIKLIPFFHPNSIKLKKFIATAKQA